jgi:histidinol-phosphate aminotransferase
MFSKKLEKLTTYEAGKPVELVVREYGIDPKDIIKLASNENPYGCSKKVQEEVAKIVNQMSVYPDDSMYELKESLSKKFNVDDKNIIIGAGSDQVLEFAIHAIEPKKVLMANTTFAMYEIYSKHIGAEILKTESIFHNLDEFREKLHENPDIIFLCLPNNPVGECLDWVEVEKFIEEVDENILIIIDGAYQEYASFKDKNKKIDPKDILKYKNVLYTGTFSKAYGLGGMRVGYGIANEFIISNLYKLRPPFNITTLSLKAAIVSLSDEEFVKDSISKNFEEMRKYEEFCKSKNLEYIQSYTNFITIFVNNSTKLSNELLKKGLIVRNLAGYGLDAIRITIGTESQNQKMFEVLGDMV